MDTSVVVKLYIREKYSREAANWLKENNESLPLTSIHELEFINALQLKQFKSEISPDETRLIMTRFEEHEKNGIYYRPPLEWSTIFIQAIALSKKHSANIGSRALDIIHVVSALQINADRFLTLDHRQSKLAVSAGLKIEKINK